METIKTISFTVGLCQFNLVPGDVEANLKRIEECCVKATQGSPNFIKSFDSNSQRRPDLLVFPELATVGYFAGQNAHRELAEEATGETAKKLQQLAQRYQVGLLVGFCERDPINSDAIYDAALCIDAKGTLIGTYRKVHLFPDSEAHFSQGHAIRPIKYEAVNIGVMICADMRSPETARALTVQGAQVLIGLTHWRHDNQQDRERLLPARAVENFLPIVDVNAMSEGSEDGEPYGNSVVFDDRGTEILRLPGSGQELVVGVVTLELYPSGKHSPYGEMHFQRREKLYAPLLADKEKGGVNVESPEAGGKSEAALHPKYILFLREHDDNFKQVLASAMATFPKAGSGYIGLVDDVGNLQIRHWVGEPGAFIMLRASEGIAGYVLRTGKTYRWHGDANHPNDPYFIPSDTKVRSELVAPIRVGPGVAGVILLDSHDEHCFDEEDAEIKLMGHAMHLGDILSPAPEKPKRIGLPQRPEEVEEVLRITSSLLNEPFVDAEDNDAAQIMAKKILAVAMEITQAMRGNIAMVDERWLKIVACQGNASDRFKDIDLNMIHSGIKGWVIRHKKAFYAPNVKGNPDKGYRAVDHYIQTHESVLSELAVPLIADDGRAIGVINLESDNENAFEVELSNPADCESITGGKHYHLFSALALIGARVVAISKQYEKFKQREEQARKTADEHKLRFRQTLIALNYANQFNQAGYVQPEFLARLSDELGKMLQDQAMRPSVEPIYAAEFLVRCIPVQFPNTVQIDPQVLGGGAWRACSALLELAVLALVNRALHLLTSSATNNPRIRLILYLRSDPIKLTVAHNSMETTQMQDALRREPVDYQTLDEELAMVFQIVSWHKGSLEKETLADGDCAYHLLIPRI